MVITNFPDGASSWGIPQLGGGILPYPSNAFGIAPIWVNGNSQTPGGDGSGPDSPLSTMAAAFTKVQSDGVIFFKGNIKEQLVTPTGIFNVTIVGCGTKPRHADLHSGYNGYSAATWKQPDSPTASTPLLDIVQQGWAFSNILWSGAPAATAAVRMFRNAGADSAERDGSHAAFFGCRFDGAPVGLQGNGGVAWILVKGCYFRGMTTAAMNVVTGAGVGTNVEWVIEESIFQDNASHIILPLNQGTIKGNTMGKFTTSSISLAGGVGYNNVWGNQLSDTYGIAGSKYISAAVTDSWSGNFNILAGGVTAALPA